MLYGLYQVVGTVVYFLLYPVILLFPRLRTEDGWGLRQRLGRIAYPSGNLTTDPAPTVWIHAASVGEVAAAGVLIRELWSGRPHLAIVLTTMTVQGLSVARRQLPVEVSTFLAPFDLPQVVRQVIHLVRPDIYVCLETELWPVMLGELQRAGIPTVLVNGRMTARSYRWYCLIPGLMKSLLSGFAGVAVISEEDGKRYSGLGVSPGRIQITGNIKFDFPSEDIAATRQRYRERLQVDRDAVFLCGSTHGREERQLAEVYQNLTRLADGNLLWVIAPRHLRRLDEIKELLISLGLKYDLYTELEQGRHHNIVLVDCLGELASLYSAGDFNFVGGSLVERGGHNLMEAARWSRPVYYGQHIDDFREAAHILENAGAGFRVDNGVQLTELIGKHMSDRTAYLKACAAAEQATASQRGAAARQATLIRRLMAEGSIT